MSCGLNNLWTVVGLTKDQETLLTKINFVCLFESLLSVQTWFDWSYKCLHTTNVSFFLEKAQSLIRSWGKIKLAFLKKGVHSSFLRYIKKSHNKVRLIFNLIRPSFSKSWDKVFLLVHLCVFSRFSSQLEEVFAEPPDWDCGRKYTLANIHVYFEDPDGCAHMVDTDKTLGQIICDKR